MTRWSGLAHPYDDDRKQVDPGVGRCDFSGINSVIRFSMLRPGVQKPQGVPRRARYWVAWPPYRGRLDR